MFFVPVAILIDTILKPSLFLSLVRESKTLKIARLNNIDAGLLQFFGLRSCQIVLAGMRRVTEGWIGGIYRHERRERTKKDDTCARARELAAARERERERSEKKRG